MAQKRHLTHSVFSGDHLNAVYWVYDDEKGKGWEDVCAVGGIDILPLLNRSCTFESVVRLIDVLEVFRPLRSLWDPIFDINFEEHLDDYYQNENTPIITEYGPDEYLEVYKGIHAQQYDKDKEYELDDHVGFHLVKPSEDIPYAIDFEPLHHFARLPVRLKNPIQMTITDAHGSQPRVTQEVATEYTLWEIIHGILWEIGFHGSPSDKGGRRAELMERVDELEKMTPEQLDALPRHVFEDDSDEK